MVICTFQTSFEIIELTGTETIGLQRGYLSFDHTIYSIQVILFIVSDLIVTIKIHFTLFKQNLNGYSRELWKTQQILGAQQRQLAMVIKLKLS